MSIASSIFGPAQAKVLGRVFGIPDRWFHVNELIRLTGLGSASLQRELRRLETSQLVQIEHVGNLKRVRANASSPVFKELRSLVRKTLGVEAVLILALEPLRPHLALAVLYGSVAKDTDRADSDIDLMVVSDELQLGDLLPGLLAAEGELGRKISPTVFSQQEYRQRRSKPLSFINKVLDGPHRVLIGAVDANGTDQSGQGRQAARRAFRR